VAGERQAVDSAPVKANASLDSLQQKRPVGEVAPGLIVVGKPVVALSPAAMLCAPAHQVRREAARQAKRKQTPDHLGARHAQARLVSNKTHYSPTDPEARICVKPGKVRALNYLCSLAVDTAQGVISHLQADLADSRDSLPLPRLLASLPQRLCAQELTLHEMLADAGYANGPNFTLLAQQRVTACIPVFGQYKPVVEDST
jgi:hypothetical protein